MDVEVPFGYVDGNWWVRATDPDGTVVYEGPGPVPPEACSLTIADIQAGRFFTFTAFPLFLLN